jgi:Capsular polysaccharide biosynthesis protein
MFKLFQKRKSGREKFDFSLLRTDMHSHLLPGIDDGAATLEDSLFLIREMQALGYQKLITTPHIFWDMFRNTPEIIGEKLALVRNAMKEQGFDIELHAAAEYFLDEHVEDLLKRKQPLLTISGNKVLTEFSMMFPSLNTKDILFELQMQGYQPIIAHPERYVYLQEDPGFYQDLKDSGCLFQLNILSIGGYYGRAVKELAEYLLEKNYYDLIGTDLHHSRHLDALRHVELTPALKKILDSGQISNHLL